MSDPRSILARFHPADIGFPADSLSDDLRAALPALVRAMRGMDALFVRQLGDDICELSRRFARPPKTPESEAFWLFKGPHDKLDEHHAFIAGAPPVRPGRGVWPADLDAAELDEWIAAHPSDREKLLDPYTVVVRRDGGLAAVPYPEAYASDLAPVAAALREAAALVRHAGLSAFLRRRADALTGHAELLESDAEWVRLRDAPLEVVVGPFETYEDGLRGVKAFYEGMLLAVDAPACARLAAIEKALPQLASAIPCPQGSRSAVGGMAPLVVADEIIATGEGHAGILAAAFNLPNDPGVRGRVGWKQVMVRNVMAAKFEACTRRIAERVLDGSTRAHLSFDAFFHHVLLHEVVHGLGPAYRADGRTVNEACGRFHSALEECKADTGSLLILVERGGSHGLPRFDAAQIGASFVAGLHRSVRFGMQEAHGIANVVQYAWLVEHGALEDSGGVVRLRDERLAGAARALLERVVLLQAAGSPSEIEAFLGRYGRPPAALSAAVERMRDLPVDILPRWGV